MGSTVTYDPTQIVVIVGGAPMVGIADGTFVKVTRDEDSFKKYVGADGEVTRARNKNRGGTVEITLSQSSPSNDVLSAFAIAGEMGDGDIVPVMVQDLAGSTLEFAGEAWVKKPADSEYGKDVAGRAWVIDCASLDRMVGGNL